MDMHQLLFMLQPLFTSILECILCSLLTQLLDYRSSHVLTPDTADISCWFMLDSWAF